MEIPEMGEVEWRTINEFPDYEVSNKGDIYNSKQRMMMRISYTNFGNAKITLADQNGNRRTRSVTQLVGDAFVRPMNGLCDSLIVLDGDFSNMAAENLAWRPRWFAWKYTHQLKTPQPNHYRNLPVLDTKHDVEYDSIIVAGMTEGLLFDDIWRSTHTGAAIYPTGSVFEVV